MCDSRKEVKESTSKMQHRVENVRSFHRSPCLSARQCLSLTGGWHKTDALRNFFAWKNLKFSTYAHSFVHSSLVMDSVSRSHTFVQMLHTVYTKKKEENVPTLFDLAFFSLTRSQDYNYTVKDIEDEHDIALLPNVPIRDIDIVLVEQFKIVLKMRNFNFQFMRDTDFVHQAESHDGIDFETPFGPVSCLLHSKTLYQKKNGVSKPTELILQVYSCGILSENKVRKCMEAWWNLPLNGHYLPTANDNCEATLQRCPPQADHWPKRAIRENVTLDYQCTIKRREEKLGCDDIEAENTDLSPQSCYYDKDTITLELHEIFFHPNACLKRLTREICYMANKKIHVPYQHD